MKQIKLINLENVSEEGVGKYRSRESARGIVFDENNNVALIHATNYHYYKLPGGGIEAGETNDVTLNRECKEEIGCNVKAIQELGITVEYRKLYNLKQTSYCYIAKLVGKKGTPKLEPDEINHGFETVWVPLEDALNKVRNSKLVVYEAQYMVARDTVLLETAIELLKNSNSII